MRWDPSHDWDRYADEQERAAMEEVNFYAQHKDAIILMTAALYAAGHGEPDKNGICGSPIDEAVTIVRIIVDRGRDPYE